MTNKLTTHITGDRTVERHVVARFTVLTIPTVSPIFTLFVQVQTFTCGGKRGETKFKPIHSPRQTDMFYKYRL